MQVDDQVKLAIKKVLKIPSDRLQDDTRLDELGAESLDIIEIVFALEEAFDIDITLDAGPMASGEDDFVRPSDLSPFATVGDVCRLVQRLVDSKVVR